MPFDLAWHRARTFGKHVDQRVPENVYIARVAICTWVGFVSEQVARARVRIHTDSPPTTVHNTRHNFGMIAPARTYNVRHDDGRAGGQYLIVDDIV